MAVAGQSAGIRWTKRHVVAAICVPRGVVAAADLSKLQSAGRGDHRGVIVDVWHSGTKAAMGGADSARRDHRVAGHERTRRRLGPGVTENPGGALLRFARRLLCGQWAEGVDVGSS